MKRKSLPNRRNHETHELMHWGFNYEIGLGRDSKDQIREVWINGGKSGTQVETSSRDAAVILSIALQYQVPVKDMQRAVMRNLDGTPQGPIGAILDLIVEMDAPELEKESA
jgi:hypothetical protein